MSWARANRDLNKKMGEEGKELGEAAGKKSLWSSLGGTLGSLGMLALMPQLGALGGLGKIFASPLGKGLGVGIGSLLGSTLGGEFLTSKKNKEILRGTADNLEFYGDEREELRDEIKDSNITSAATSGLTAGMTAWGTKPLEIGEIAEVATPTGALANTRPEDILKRISEMPVKPINPIIP